MLTLAGLPSRIRVMSLNSPPGERLDSWKEIALYLDRDVSTVRRWEREEGLPVRRHIHHKQATIYAYRSEIDAWLDDRHPGSDGNNTHPSQEALKKSKAATEPSRAFSAAWCGGERFRGVLLW